MNKSKQTRTSEALPLSHFSLIEQSQHNLTSSIEQDMKYVKFSQEREIEDTAQGPKLFPHIPPDMS